MTTDTIAAVATALSNSGIGIIRVSGNDAVPIVNTLFKNKKRQPLLEKMNSHTIQYGFIVNDQDEIVDEVMVSLMKAPRSFTTEDTVEINCHGGVLMINKILGLLLSHGARLEIDCHGGVFIVKKILETVIRNGARTAEPGEFTKRAFLNGRIDLSEAEAVMDVIASENDMALKNSMRQLQGSVSDKIKDLRAKILYEIAFIESALDDPEHISLDGYPEELEEKVDQLIKEIAALIETSENGKIISDGIRTVIVGKPNAGKSSLLNLLAGEEKAIVTEIAGTTRDILEENIRLSGINLHVIDTAGIRSTEDVVEKIGVTKAKKYAMDADLIVYVVDSSVPLDENDLDILELIRDKKSIILYNKSDLDSKVSLEELSSRISSDTKIIKTSTKENTGFDEFSKAVEDLFFQGKIGNDQEVMITNMRHKQALSESLLSLQEVKNSLINQMPEDFYSIDLMNAYASLGRIIGEEIDDDLVTEIFSKFCMGK